MIFWVFTVVVAVCMLYAVVKVWMDSYDDWVFKIGMTLFSVFISAIIWLFVVMLLAMLSSTFSEPQNVPAERRELSALSTGNELSGKFFLGSGRIDEEQVFTYLWEDSQGGTRLDSSLADKSVVYQDEENAPYMEIKATRSGINEFIAPFSFKSESYEYEYHIPNGSIINNYEVTP